MNTNGFQIVNRIDHVLSNRGLTRNDLCRELNMKSNTLSNWKTRGSILSADDAFTIAKYLRISPLWLVYGDDEQKDSRSENLTSKFSQLSDSEKNAVETLVDGFLGRKK